VGWFLLNTLLLMLFLVALVCVIIQKVRGPLAARGSESEDDSHIPLRLSETNKIRTALDLLMGQGGTGSFVIFEAPRSGKFVQFAGASNENLLLDLPTLPLSDDETARAREFFKQFGIGSPVLYEADNVKKGIVQKFISFQMDLDKDTERAARLVAAIFQQVYQFPPDTAIVARVNLETQADA